MAITSINNIEVLGISHDRVSHWVRRARFPLKIEFSDRHGTVCVL